MRAAAERDRELLGAEADPIHPARIYGELVPRLADDSVVIGDGGDFVSFAGKYVEPKRPGGWLDPGPYGCLGAGLGSAIAARLARPSAQVVLLLGDGAAGFSLMDVDTLVRHDLPVVMVMGNNSAWGLEKGPMQMIYGYDVIADLAHRTRYDEVVKALGGGGETVTDPKEIGPALDRAFDSRTCRTWSTSSPTSARRTRATRSGSDGAHPAGGTRGLRDRRARSPRRRTRSSSRAPTTTTARSCATPRPGTARPSCGWRSTTTGRCSAASPRARPGSPWRELSVDGEGEFRMLAVAPAARGRGVGEALVRQCEERAAATARPGCGCRRWTRWATRSGSTRGSATAPSRRATGTPQPELLPDVHLRAWTKEL